MTEDLSARQIRDKALELGFHHCGIIPVSELAGYQTRLSERIRRFPETGPALEKFALFSEPQRLHPWAKSVIICAFDYGIYRVPVQLSRLTRFDGRMGESAPACEADRKAEDKTRKSSQKSGLFAKGFLFDGRQDRASAQYHASKTFERFLNDHGIKNATERKYGLVPLRYAAERAGLGIVRRNNFFYTEKGSWSALEAWLIDRDWTWRESDCQTASLDSRNRLKPCPPNCHLCQDACPTKALAEPYAMNQFSCVAFLNTLWNRHTTLDGRNLPCETFLSATGEWMYGCDACQDACPFNHEKWEEKESFPGLESLADDLNPIRILEMSDSELREKLVPKFWYISEKEVWKFKLNALAVLFKYWKAEYEPIVRQACSDASDKVRQMAAFVLAEKAKCPQYCRRTQS